MATRFGFVPAAASSSAAAFLLLVACATPEQRAEQWANDIKANYGPVCEKLGYEAGSEKHRDCMVSMFNSDQLRLHVPPGWAWNRPWPW